MARHEENIRRAMVGLVEAHGSLQRVRDALEGELAKVNPTTVEGKAQEAFILSVHRAVEALTNAVARVPDEFWLLHLSKDHAGLQEVIQRLKVA